MREIPLTKGRIALVDEDLYDELSQYKWHCNSNGYAGRRVSVEGRSVIELMHRRVMGLRFGDGLMVDHINLDKTDNRVCNLRVCTHSQNQMNKVSRKGSSSKYRGVGFHKKSGKWMAAIRHNQVREYLGVFEKEEDAAVAYNEASMKYHGEYARLNVIDN